jgi:hypothetical protein
MIKTPISDRKKLKMKKAAVAPASHAGHFPFCYSTKSCLAQYVNTYEQASYKTATMIENRKKILNPGMPAEKPKNFL